MKNNTTKAYNHIKAAQDCWDSVLNTIWDILTEEEKNGLVSDLGKHLHEAKNNLIP